MKTIKMKKIYTILIVSILAMAAAFALKETKVIYVTGTVNPLSYTFYLVYGDNDSVVQEEDNIATKYDLSIPNETEMFRIHRSSGNLNDDLVMTVDITANPFVGSFDRIDDYEIALTPEIVLDTNYEGQAFLDYNYLDTVKTYRKKFNVYVESGFNSEETDIVGFHLFIPGDNTVPAGDFSSLIQIEYTYDTR